MILIIQITFVFFSLFYSFLKERDLEEMCFLNCNITSLFYNNLGDFLTCFRNTTFWKDRSLFLKQSLHPFFLFFFFSVTCGVREDTFKIKWVIQFAKNMITNSVVNHQQSFPDACDNIRKAMTLWRCSDYISSFSDCVTPWTLKGIPVFRETPIELLKPHCFKTSHLWISVSTEISPQTRSWLSKCCHKASIKILASFKLIYSPVLGKTFIQFRWCR